MPLDFYLLETIFSMLVLLTDIRNENYIHTVVCGVYYLIYIHFSDYVIT